MNYEIYKFHYVDKLESFRVDVWLANQLNESGKCHSRSYIQKLCDEELVTVNGIVRKKNYRLSSGDVIEIRVPPVKEIELEGEDISLDIVYEDKYIIALNKQPGMVVHPAPGNVKSTLVNALLTHCKDLSAIGGTLRPGIVHRLDKETSGIMLVAKTNEAHLKLSKALKNREIKKVYECIVVGAMKDNAGIIEAKIGRSHKNRKAMAIDESNGREAITEYKVIERYDQFTYLNIMPRTGRTHQIRVHLSSIGYPILGDKVYLPNRLKTINITNKNKSLITELKKVNRHLLHSRMLCFYHPITGEYMELSAELPDDFKEVLNLLRTLL